MGNTVTVSIITELPIYAKRYVLRKVRRFNVIPRADKKIDKILTEKKAERAPLYEPTRKIVEDFLKENPDGLREINEKDTKFHETLQNVYVSSSGKNEDAFSVARVDPSLQKRFELENVTEETIPPGKFSIKKAEEFLFAHQKDPQEFSIPVLAKIYSIDEKVMKNILDHVKLFKITFPEKQNVKMTVWQKLTQGLLPTELLEESTIDQFNARMNVKYRNILQFHQKLAKPPPEGLPPPTVGELIERKLRAIDARHTGIEIEDGNKAIKPEHVQPNIYGNELEITKNSETKQEITEEVKTEKALEVQQLDSEKIIETENVPFDVFEKVEDKKLEDTKVKMNKSLPTKKPRLEVSEKV